MKPVVVLGSLNMDLVVRSPRLPAPGETLLGGPFQTFPGGKGANQAVAIARLGYLSAMIGRIGQDAFGSELLESLTRDGVDVAAVKQDRRAATGVALITVGSDGQNTIVVASGANHRVSPADVEDHASLIAGAALLVLQLECPLDAVQAAAHLARQNGVPVLLNPAPACPLSDELLSSVDVLVPNQTEAALLTGGLEPETAARQLKQRGASAVIVTLGAEGVYLLDNSGSTHLPAHKVKAIDTVAAGDAFVGALAVALAEGKSLREAAHWGNAAGAIAVTRQGAQPSLPTRKEVLALLEETR